MYKTLLILGTEPKSIINFRKELIIEFLKKGFDVTAVSSHANKKFISLLTEMSVDYETITLKRNGLNLFYDLMTLYNLASLFKKSRPDVILAYGVKLVIWGGFSSKLTNASFFALITGLGFAFQGDSLKRRALSRLVVFLYRVALINSKAVIFQNKDNRDVFVKKNIVPFSKTYIINGSGVNTEKFDIAKLPSDGMNFLCLARLLGEKGLKEYAAAAKIVKEQFTDVNFILVGSVDSSPDAISLKEVNRWRDYIDYKGSTNDVRPYIENCHVYVLPSYHEGIPRSTLEAMSMGRPIITTDAVGCRDTVEDGINGFKVPVASVMELVDRMIWFIKNKDKIQDMGLHSRAIVDSKFDVNKVNKKILDIMGLND